ncbi:hypothetical protein HUE46_01190 [Flavobacterium columnare]|uniref:hypothetical protein n=1 Tax=Flavobacterium columnare TaxID=996 RepID=UPI001780E9D6|nr:hypothetical protein [Flavobacterium columnare]MBF6654793.1 hypothetical protein [Flavobacterium columnare]MEB3799877.1 hypothetical protein [Flavobacterium columnare]QOG88740.1 hypothetical protein HUE41_01190 [Flavobacterium columnare]QOG91399.1 hypothetical protein HUE42_01185 [Flavobacterium columnare]QOG94062.1 hypothetical protein HUE43_01190 [Flavobacterium columnare]
MKFTFNNFFLIFFLFLLSNCQSQQNEKYIGLKYGIFDIDKVTFTENIDTLFSKIPHVEILKEINGRKMRVFRVKSIAQDKKLFKYFNIEEGNTEFYLDDKNNLVRIHQMINTNKNTVDNFLEKVRRKYGINEKKIVKKKFIDDMFIGQLENKLVYITKSCNDQDCSIVYNIYKYPQKDNDIISFMSLNNIDLENLLKK